MGEKHTRHDWCACGSFRNLQMVDTSWLSRSLLLPVCPSRALFMSGWEASWLWVVREKMPHPSTIEAGVLISRSLKRGSSPGIHLLLRGPIVLRPLNILRGWSDHHWLLPGLLEEGSGRGLICQPRALGSTSKRSNSDLSFPLFQVMKPKVFLHCNSVIY